MKGSVLITGASGFLGYHIINSAIEQGLNVYAAVRKKSDVEHLSKLSVKYIILNYEDKQDLALQLADNEIEYIIHAAGVTKAIKQDIYDKINAKYTLNLAEAAALLGEKFKRFIFISSLAAIGPLKDEHNKLTENTIPNPVTAYGRSKLLAEKGLQKISIPTTILRPTAIYGPRDKDIFIMVKTLNRGFDPYMGNILQKLSFVHVKDVADVAVKSLFIQNALGIYNITDGNCYNRYQLSDITKRLLKRKAFRFHIPMPLIKMLAFFLEITNGLLKKPAVINREKLLELGAKNWICDISKAKQDLNFKPTFDLQTGLENSITWYKNNKWL